MAATTAMVAGGGSSSGGSGGGWKGLMAKAKAMKAAKNKVKPHGDEAHTDTGGAVGNETAIANEEATADTALAFKSSPAKNMKTGDYSQGFEGGTGGYKPFEMKAKKYNNSPIEKNYGSPAQRGIATSKGLAGGEPGKPQAKTGVGSGLNFAAVGSSPAKGFFSKIRKAAKNIFKKAPDPLNIKEKLGLGGGGAGGGTGGGDGSHTHGADGGVVANSGAVPDPAVAGPVAPATGGTGGLAGAMQKAIAQAQPGVPAVPVEEEEVAV